MFPELRQAGKIWLRSLLMLAREIRENSLGSWAAGCSEKLL